MCIITKANIFAKVQTKSFGRVSFCDVAYIGGYVVNSGPSTLSILSILSMI